MAEPQRHAAHAAFARAAAAVTPVEFRVRGGALAVAEDVPFMHIPPGQTEARVWWRSEV